VLVGMVLAPRFPKFEFESLEVLSRSAGFYV
jgi:hypothetical protein